jgi:hypothetical protein
MEIPKISYELLLYFTDRIPRCNRKNADLPYAKRTACVIVPFHVGRIGSTINVVSEAMEDTGDEMITIPAFQRSKGSDKGKKRRHRRRLADCRKNAGRQ